MARRLVLVFARSPADECRAKPLGPATARKRAEALHRSLLERTLATAGRIAGTDVRLVTTGDLAAARRAALRLVREERLEVEAQTGGALGPRLSFAVERAFLDGYTEVVTVGADTPDLCADDLSQAFAQLGADPRGPAAVLGPAPDGGFYLLGLTAFTPAAFDAASLGTARARAAARRALADAGYRVDELSAHRDVDSAVDLARIETHLRGALAPADLRLRRLALALLSSPVPGPVDTRCFASVFSHRSVDARGPPIGL